MAHINIMGFVGHLMITSLSFVSHWNLSSHKQIVIGTFVNSSSLKERTHFQF